MPFQLLFGCAQVICSDKTSTLTIGAMTARKIVTSEQMVSVSGEGFSPPGCSLPMVLSALPQKCHCWTTIAHDALRVLALAERPLE